MPIPEHLAKLLDEPVVTCSVDVVDWDVLSDESQEPNVRDWYFGSTPEFKAKRHGARVAAHARRGTERLLNYHRRMGHNVK